MKNTVYIHTNNKQMFGAKLAQFSIVSAIGRKPNFGIEIININDYPQFTAQNNQVIIKNGHRSAWDLNDLQSFTLLRFLPPEIQNYQGRAIVIDPDVFCVNNTNITELFETPLNGKRIGCSRQNNHLQSSVMLLECSKLKHWNSKTLVEKLFTTKDIDYRKMMSLEYEDPQDIFIINNVWNHLDRLNDETKLIHFTRRRTQPWKTGLKIDFTYDQSKRMPLIPRPVFNYLKRKLKRGHTEWKTYQPNPNINQVRAFKTLANAAIESGFITKDFIQEQVESGFIRSDFLEFIKN